MLCTTFEQRDIHRLRIFLRLPLFVTPIRILPVNKILRNLERMQFIAKSLYAYIKNLFATRFEEAGRISPLQLSSQTHLAKIEDKKSYCEELVLKT